MTTGDSTDILTRIKRILPPRWFAYTAPLRDAVLGGLADQLAWVYSFIAFAKLQTRITSATGFFLDLIAYDYFGRFLRRRAGELDAAFMPRIKKEIVRERVTRKGMIGAITDLTGAPPQILEPWNTGDTGVWDNGTLAYDIAGCWGDTNLPNQVFVIIARPGLQGIPFVSGWDVGAGGWDVGAIEWTDPSMIVGAVTDQDIYDTIEATKPTGSIVWTQLSGTVTVTTGSILDFSDPTESGLLTVLYPLWGGVAASSGTGQFDFSKPANSGLITIIYPLRSA